MYDAVLCMYLRPAHHMQSRSQTYHDQCPAHAALPYMGNDHVHEVALAEVIVVVLPGRKDQLEKRYQRASQVKS